ncbi:MAG: hypothetical protein OXC19_22625 [Bryobacterales bacterium]|nr:hypothetical protein [Bryobacterales bacterium]
MNSNSLSTLSLLAVVFVSGVYGSTEPEIAEWPVMPRSASCEHQNRWRKSQRFRQEEVGKVTAQEGSGKTARLEYHRSDPVDLFLHPEEHDGLPRGRHRQPETLENRSVEVDPEEDLNRGVRNASPLAQHREPRPPPRIVTKMSERECKMG